MNSDDLVNALRTVPQVRLRLTELAWKLTGDDGSLDAEKLAFHHQELVEAIHEAEAYEKSTIEAVRCLMSIAHSQF